MTGSLTVLAAALLLDAVFGEPDRLWSRVPHPAVLMGKSIDALDHRFNRDGSRRLRGVLVVIALGLIALGLGRLLEVLIPTAVLDVLVVAILLAQRSLVDHVAAVGTGLRESLDAGRGAVASIVGRDVSSMDEPAVVRAAIESGAENFSDGVVAPAFWYLLGGLPGILFYKAVNTADSMIGYRTPRHQEFGWAAARLDDVMNWIPARASAALILLAHGRVQGWREITEDAKRHRSPNAGWPEAAMARCLGMALCGPRSYDGEVRDFPFINQDGDRNPGAASIDACVVALWRAWGLMALAVALIAVS